jgi:hypothetical protein
MILGQNANVAHGGRTFHVQTEDSGRAHPHVITHLYYEGTILASERRDYAELVDAPDLGARVRRLMEEQHAAMVERLRRGDFDGAIAARLGAPTPAARPAPTEMHTPPASEPAAPRVPRAPARPGAPAAPARAPAAPAGRPRAFGEGIVSERPLDDVILEYLVAQSRERTGGGRGSRSEG